MAEITRPKPSDEGARKCERCRGFGLDMEAPGVEKCADCGGHGFNTHRPKHTREA